MTSALTHRGPDDGGVFFRNTENCQVGVGHRRLSILDLSPTGHQPMKSNSGRFIIVYNGEIYNHATIRTQLENVGAVFRGRSDTETLLAAVETWGLELALKKCAGMFAFALWDDKEKVLHLCRDRMGEKPLYYGWRDNTFMFASELKAMRRLPGWRGDIDKIALGLLMRHMYIPAPHSIYQGISKLLPGHLVSVPVENGIVGQIEQRPYWALHDAVARGCANQFTGNEVDAVDALEELLKKIVGEQMIADVPLGAFLSGGYDSSLVASIMQANASTPIKTFSIGFPHDKYNEAPYAKAVAEHLQTQHTEFYVTPEEAMDVIPQLPDVYDEPFADYSQIPTMILCRLTRRNVKVSLSGDGGDELMRGYKHYQQIPRLWRRLNRVPLPLRKGAAGMAATLGGCLNAFPAKLADLNKRGQKMRNSAMQLRAKDFHEFYELRLSKWKKPSDIVSEFPSRMNWNHPLVFDDMQANIDHFMLYRDAVTYLPDDILVKADRAAMAVALETRMPLLDHRLVEFAWSLPDSFRWRQGAGKWALRQVLYRHVPPPLVDRPKQGFTVPLGDWLRKGPVFEWAADILTEDNLAGQDLLDKKSLLKIWRMHLAGRADYKDMLWPALMFLAGT